MIMVGRYNGEIKFVFAGETYEELTKIAKEISNRESNKWKFELNLNKRGIVQNEKRISK